MIWGMKIRRYRAKSFEIGLLALLILGSLLPVLCQVDEEEYSRTGNPKVLPLVTSLIYNQILNLTKVFNKELTSTLGYCTRNVDTDINQAFKFAKNLDFLSECVKETKDVTKRICTAAEMKFYFTSFMDKKNAEVQHLKPNINCNLTAWAPGCEPGWSCSVPQGVKVDLKESQNFPVRVVECQPCCAGFFCPQGLTCMIPCPLGSYCPRATLNETTGICEPYMYQLPPGKNHSCGAADKWAGVTTNDEIFCKAGSFCPTNTQKIPCATGHYCLQGSTEQRECVKFSTCNPKTDTQNLHGWGFLVIGILSLLLIVFYNFSDQVLLTKYERLAKSRERAARSARDAAAARQRWRMAKEAAKKGLAQQELSKIQSRRVAEPPPPPPPKPPEPAPAGGSKHKKDPVNLTKMLLSMDTDDNKGFDMTIGDKNLKQTPAKQLHTKSQIFKYAYGQLEKEKALEEQKQDMSLTGVISMATETVDIKTRPKIEVSFKDLTITLRNKNVHLMRRVTGKLYPGRISAVMGPSGAGKTTFLSAVAGKIRGCTLTGEININGKPHSIQCYQKIVGFVPQDDIVHGNLTVEENLRFCARCRLPKEMPKADKVLVVERTIDSLGLQPVRESLVGTVEKRGISGGQRKRVNVGLEMVMEPSLLILDEPTSGLDSSSSNLLLKALKREAGEGVNICMVLHQPSYALYQMFDDLILLAKGGLTVYHGPVKKAEEYFSSFGINVPERVNPPDHFIDILEGIYTPTNGVTPEQLPIRWMLHNGYPVPPDMLHYCDEIANKGGSGSASLNDISEEEENDPDQDKQNPKDENELPLLKYLPVQDLSDRVTPGWKHQYRYFLGRSIKQRLREAKLQAADYMILLLAGACLGTLSKTQGDTFGYYGYMYAVIAISLLCMISALRSFSLDKLHYQRERASGMSSLAYFLAKDTVDHFNTLVKPVVFLALFYSFNIPRSTFLENYLVFLCLVYCVTGMAYVLAILFVPSQAQLWCVLLPVVMTLMTDQSKEDEGIRSISIYCFSSWAVEAFLLANAQRFEGVWLITRCAELNNLGYNVHNWAYCLFLLLVLGVFSRAVAYVCLILFGKK